MSRGRRKDRTRKTDGGGKGEDQQAQITELDIYASDVSATVDDIAFDIKMEDPAFREATVRTEFAQMAEEYIAMALAEPESAADDAPGGLTPSDPGFEDAVRADFARQAKEYLEELDE